MITLLYLCFIELVLRLFCHWLVWPLKPIKAENRPVVLVKIAGKVASVRQTEMWREECGDQSQPHTTHTLTPLPPTGLLSSELGHVVVSVETSSTVVISADARRIKSCRSNTIMALVSNFYCLVSTVGSFVAAFHSRVLLMLTGWLKIKLGCWHQFVSQFRFIAQETRGLFDCLCLKEELHQFQNLHLCFGEVARG